MKLYRDLLPEEEAGVVSRIYLMHGCRFDDDSILQRLDMDCGLSWTHLDLAIAKVQLSISNDVWARAYNLLMTKHGAGLSSIHAFDIARKTHPGEAGFVLGKALTAKASELEKIFPEGSTQILAGYRLAHALAGANTLSIEIVPLQPIPQKEAAPIRIKPGQFEGLKIWEAARTFLEMTQTPQSTTQIATCLIKGGIASRAQSLETNLYTVLKNKSDIFVKIGPGLWGLKNAL